MKLLLGVLSLLVFSPLALSFQDTVPSIGIPSAREQCCHPLLTGPPPSSSSCPGGTFCSPGPLCSGTNGPSIGGLFCTSGEGACSASGGGISISGLPEYSCSASFIGQNICMQMYPKYKCVWSPNGGTGTGSYSGSFCTTNICES